jgi:hypothetical protein
VTVDLAVRPPLLRILEDGGHPDVHADSPFECRE